MNNLQQLQLNKYNGAIRIYTEVNKVAPPEKLKDKWANMLCVTRIRNSNAS